MIELIIIRHGETIENANNICQGQGPGQLSELGIRQVKQLAEKLQHETFDFVYSSDLQRTIDTTAEILKFHPEMKMITTPLLRERSLKVWEGKPFPENWSWDYLPEGAETNEDMMDRAQAFIELVLAKHNGKRIAAITHGGFIRALWTVVAQKPASEYFTWKGAQNTSVSRVVLHSAGAHEIIEMNNTDHLSVATPGTNQSFS